jgi:hypothetical protein
MIIQYISEGNDFYFRRAKNWSQLSGEENHIKLFSYHKIYNKAISVNDYYDEDIFLQNCNKIKGTL